MSRDNKTYRVFIKALAREVAANLPHDKRRICHALSKWRYWWMGASAPSTHQEMSS